MVCLLVPSQEGPSLVTEAWGWFEGWIRSACFRCLDAHKPYPSFQLRLRCNISFIKSHLGCLYRKPTCLPHSPAPLNMCSFLLQTPNYTPAGDKKSTSQYLSYPALYFSTLGTCHFSSERQASWVGLSLNHLVLLSLHSSPPPPPSPLSITLPSACTQ